MCRHSRRNQAVHSSLVPNATDVVDQQPFLVFFLLEEGLESVTDIEDAKRLRVSAEDRHTLKVLRRHPLPGGMQIILRVARENIPAHQFRNGHLYDSRVRQMTDDIGLADDACGPVALIANNKSPSEKKLSPESRL